MKYWKLYMTFWCFTGAVSGWSQALDSVLLRRMTLDLCKPGDSLLHYVPYWACYGEQEPTPQPNAAAFTHTLCAWLTANQWCLEVAVYQSREGNDQYNLHLSQRKASQLEGLVSEKCGLADRCRIKGMGETPDKKTFRYTKMLLKIQRCP